jgi:hypothetical protein
MYAATWYDLKPLGYYNYMSGGKGGVFYGGGVRIGGACVRGSLMAGIVWCRCRRFILGRATLLGAPARLKGIRWEVLMLVGSYDGCELRIGHVHWYSELCLF